MEGQEPQKAEDQETIATGGEFKRKLAKAVLIPAGIYLRIKRRTMGIMWKAGIIPNALMPMVKESLETGGPIKPDKSKWTEEQLTAMMTLVDRIIVDNVVEPKIHHTPKCSNCHKQDLAHDEDTDHEFEGEVRSEDELYVDELDDENRMFIYGYVTGGFDNLESFRKITASSLESVSDGEGVRDEAESVTSDQG